MIDLRSINEIVHYLPKRENLQRRDNPKKPAVSALNYFFGGGEKYMHCGKPEFFYEKQSKNNATSCCCKKKAKGEYVDKFTEILMASKGHLCIKWAFNSCVELDPVTGICRCKTRKCTACKK